MRVCLFEERAETLDPLSLTRPIFELRCGLTTLGQKLLRYVSVAEWGALIRPTLQDLYRQEQPQAAVNDPDWLGQDDLLLVNGRWLPPREPFAMPAGSCVGAAVGGVAYVVLHGKDRLPLSFEQLPALLEHWRHTLPVRSVGGEWIHYPWDLVEHNPAEIERDFAAPTLSPSAESAAPVVVGPRDRLWIAPSAKVEPLSFLDTTGGPIVIEPEAVVSAFSRLEGPCCIGARSQVFGAKIRAGTTLGPQCRVGGEVEASILHGYANKYHEGFLGHSYVGEWVNLGAGTHNSDLRNDYGEITITVRGERIPTGLTKVGCFLGDHTKTGLGTLLNTGTSVGAFCNLLPAGRFAPKYVPSFLSWWNGVLCEAFTLEQLLTTAEVAMKRRGVPLSAAHRSLYAWLLRDTQDERRRVLRESEQRQLRRSA
jgi:UDP-N-acetylglucosamine diphosphorylase/glucosamine-1-phosphate N-acetyltransferase